MSKNLEKATFGAGCFWGVEAAFRMIKGVKSTRVGYIGGKTKDPSYEEVCSDTSGYAEAVEVTFDPSKVTYKQLLEVFWNNHNPTTLNSQGPDVGSQYRSAIFYHNSKQKTEVTNSMKALQKSKKFGDRKIVTEIVPATEFYEAEDYHQQYLEKRELATCHIYSNTTNKTE